MICVEVKKLKSSEVIEFHCEGHAEYADYGEDIVCAAVSVLTQNCINAIDELTKAKFISDRDEEDGAIDFVLHPDSYQNAEAQLLLESMILGLKNISKTYGDYVVYNETVIKEA